MQISFLDVMIAIIALVLLMIPGFILGKIKLLKEDADAVLSILVLYVCQPAQMFLAFQKTEYSSKIAINMLIVAGLTLLIMGLMIVFSFIVIRGNDKRKSCMRFASVFGNCGYMGIPFLQILFGETNAEVVLYCSVVVMIFNILNWSIGVYMISGDKKQMSIKNAVLSPSIIAIVIGLIVFVTVKRPLVSLVEVGTVGYKIISSAIKSLEFLDKMVTPLAMILIGLKLAKVTPKALFVSGEAHLTVFYKLIIMSFLSIGILYFLPIDNMIKAVMFFTMSMPSATATTLFAVRFNGDSFFASINVLLSTIVSILTIPVMFLAFKAICGI